jgi:alkylation response protein AidB-like acyl-CoA dehydrogenase
MALVLTEEQGMLCDSASVFLTEKSPVSRLRELRDSRDASGFSRDLWAAFADMGFTGILVPEAQGGLGLGYVEAGVVMEEIGRNLTASPFLASSVVAVTALRQAGSEAQQQLWLPALASGKSIATLAVDEQTKHRPQHIAMTASQRADGYTLNGRKTFVLDGHVADVLIVAARTSGASADTVGITLFLVDAKTPGVEIERVFMVDAHNSARVVFEDVVVSLDAVLGPVDGGPS